MDAETIKKSRESLNLSQAEFADLLSVSQATISRWETSGATGIAEKYLTGEFERLKKKGTKKDER